MTRRRLLGCVFASILIGERSWAQLSFLPISSREGLTANTSVARSRSSLAPLSNPASSAARGEDQMDSEISISSNLYMLTMVESRGGSDKGSFRSGYSSIPTSLGGRRTFGRMQTTFGLYQSERYVFDYRYPLSLARMKADLDVSHAAVAVGMKEDGFRWGFAMCATTYQLHVDSQSAAASSSQSGSVYYSWEERTRTDISLSLGAILDLDDGISIGLSIRSPSLELMSRDEGNRVMAAVSPSASASTISIEGLSNSNQLLGNGVEGIVGFSIDGSSHRLSSEIAFFENRGNSMTGVGGEVLVRLGDEYRYSDSTRLIAGLAFGVADAFGHDISARRKTVPVTATVGSEFRFAQDKVFTAGLFHSNFIDWEIEDDGRFPYSVPIRRGMILAGALEF